MFGWGEYFERQNSSGGTSFVTGRKCRGKRQISTQVSYIYTMYMYIVQTHCFGATCKHTSALWSVNWSCISSYKVTNVVCLLEQIAGLKSLFHAQQCSECTLHLHLRMYIVHVLYDACSVTVLLCTRSSTCSTGILHVRSRSVNYDSYET